MKTLQELLLCVEDDIELMGLSHIIYLMEQNGETVDYDYLPSEFYTEAVTLKELQDELLQRQMLVQSVGKSSGSSKGQKLAVLFPGIGYTCDRPLLYYSARIARSHGYDILPVPYTNFPKNCKNDPQKMQTAFTSALSQAEMYLKDTDWSQFSELLFLSKSIGTVVSAAYADRHHLPVRQVLFTPLAETFRFPVTGSIAFHGTADPWVSTEILQKSASEKGVPLFLTEHANHSLETGDIRTDLRILETVLKQVEQYLLL